MELVMVEQDGCAYCARWNAEIAEIYPKTPEGAYAPLRRVDLRAPMPDDLSFKGPVIFTPTFILVEDGEEQGRIEGYAGDELFWDHANHGAARSFGFRGDHDGRSGAGGPAGRVTGHKGHSREERMKLFKIMALSANMGAAVLATPAVAQDDDAFVTFQVLKPEVAQTAAIAAMESCREAGYQVGVMVVDRFGIPQVYVRDRFAGLHVFETARRKAWTAVSFRTDTLSLGELTAPGEMMAGIRELSEPLALGGGLCD